MAQLGREARGFPSCPEKQSPPFSPGLFQKSPLPPAPTCLCCWQPVRAGGVWGLAAVGLFSRDGIESCAIKQPLPWYRTLSALSCSCVLDLSPNQA